MAKRFSIPALWLMWGLVVFGAFNIYGPSLWSYRAEAKAQQLTQAELIARLTPWQFVGLLLRNDNDTARYFSYANAILGRPYGGYYVRPMTGWTESEDENARQKPTALVQPDRPLLPWRDFSVEYPPGMLVFALAPALLTRDFGAYHLLFSIEMEFLLTLALWLGMKSAELIRPGLGREVLSLSIPCVAALGIIAVRRYDAAVALTLAAAFYGLIAARPVTSGLALAAGAVVKGVPVLLAPIGVIFYASQRAWGALARSLAAASLVMALAGAAFFALAGSHAADMLFYHGDRPVQIESLYGGALAFARVFDPDIAETVASFGSANIASAYEPLLRRLGSILPLLAVAGVYIWLWRALRRATDGLTRFRVLLAAICGVLVALMALGKIFSPQYLVWLMPLGVMASALSSSRSRIQFFMVCLLTQIEYPFVYAFFSAALDPRFGLLVLVRDVILLWWGVLLMVEAEAPAPVVAEAQPAPA